MAAGAHKLRILEAKARWSVFQALGSQGVGGQLTEVRASPSECLFWAWGQETFMGSTSSGADVGEEVGLSVQVCTPAQKVCRRLQPWPASSRATSSEVAVPFLSAAVCSPVSSEWGSGSDSCPIPCWTASMMDAWSGAGGSPGLPPSGSQVISSKRRMGRAAPFTDMKPGLRARHGCL